MLDAVENCAVLLAENDVAVLSHQLNDQALASQISELVEMLDLKVDDSLKTRLADLHDSAGADMFSQEHAEIRSRQWAWLILVCKVDERKACARRDRQTQSLPVVFYRKEKLVFLRLSDLVDLSTLELRLDIMNQICNYNSVKCHIFIPRVISVAVCRARGQ